MAVPTSLINRYCNSVNIIGQVNYREKTITKTLSEGSFCKATYHMMLNCVECVFYLFLNIARLKLEETFSN